MANAPTQRPVVLSDLTADLLWPRLLSVVPLSLGLSRLFASFVGVVLCAAMMKIPLSWEEGRSLAELWRAQPYGRGVKNAEVPFVSELIRTIADPALAGLSLLREHPWAMATAIPTLIFASLFAATVARSAAMSFGKRTPVGFAASFAGAVRSFPAVVIGVMWPLVVVGVILLGLSVAGATLWTWGIGQMVGGVGYGLALLFSGLAMVLLGAWVVAWPLLVPAAVCEGGASPSAGDGLDATQRVLAYVYNAPLRLLLYASLCIIQVIAAVIVFEVLREATIVFARWSSTMWVQEEAIRQVFDIEGTFANKAVAFWITMLDVARAALVFSLVVCGGTATYLLIRRCCDGQDESELPGMESARADG